MQKKQSIRSIVKNNMNRRERELLEPIVSASTISKEAPRWGDVIDKPQIETELRKLQEKDRDLAKQLAQLAPEVSETLVTLDSLDTKDADGKESQDRIEDRVFSILRRVKNLENMCGMRQSWIDQNVYEQDEKQATRDSADDLSKSENPSLLSEGGEASKTFAVKD